MFIFGDIVYSQKNEWEHHCIKLIQKPYLRSMANTFKNKGY